MSTTGQRFARDARDRLVRVLNLGLPHPLRDLPLRFPHKVALGEPVEVEIVDGQKDVRYRLCDEEGNLFVGTGGKTYEAEDRGAQGIVLVTPPIKEDITFTILASRDDEVRDRTLETYLAGTVGLRVGIDRALPVTFVPGPGQWVVAGEASTISWGERVTVQISGSQSISSSPILP